MRKELGNKYGLITITEEQSNGKVLGKCDCGTIRYFNLRDLRREKTKGCGCLKNTPELREQSSLRAKKLRELGILNTKGDWRNEEQKENSKFLYILKSINNKNRKENINITIETLKETWIRQNGICPYSKIKLLLPTHSDHLTNEDPWLVASIDRINSTLPYSSNNIQFVSRTINYAKGNLSHEDMIRFLEFIKKS
jgi:hypothetical protein